MPKLSKPTKRRLTIVSIAIVALASWLIFNPANYQPIPTQANVPTNPDLLATKILEKLEVSDHYKEIKYNREDHFYKSWATINGCDMRNTILQRDLVETTLEGCTVQTGILHDPYTGTTINFQRGTGTSSAVQIDHVIALSNAWATGAHRLEKTERHALSQDPLNLLAVDGPTNGKKSDQDASSWLPPNPLFQCTYIARQISVKFKYTLWITQPEKQAMQNVLKNCPNEPTIGLEEIINPAEPPNPQQ